MSQSQPESPESMPELDLSGRQLGDYRLLRRLGRGNMAEVYLAEQMSLRRQVAIKVLKHGLANDASYVRRFHNEAQAAASLIHANIVQIYEVGCVDGIHFIAQEYVPGRNLKQLLARSGPVEARLAVNIMWQVAAALHKSSEQAIVHRDIKPENIMLADSGEVKVADFGLARFTRDGTGVDLTQVGMTMGTPLYMSPEQVEGRVLDSRSDLYSFGVTCYHMLTGRPPFEGDTALSVAVQHLKSEPPRLEDLRPDLPGGLCRAVHKMLAKEPDDRYRRPAELLRELRSLRKEGLGEDWSPEQDDWATPELIAVAEERLEATRQLEVVMRSEAMQHHRRNNVWRAAIASAAAAAFLVGAVLAWQTRPPSLLALPPDQRPQIEPMGSAKEQYWYAAYTVGTEEALKSVEKYFPPDEDPLNELYVRWSKVRLAELYLGNEEFDKAMAQYVELANVEETEPQFRVLGLVGQANVHCLQGDKQQAESVLSKVIPLYDKLKPRDQQDLPQRLEPDLRPSFDRLLGESRRVERANP